MPSKIKNCIGTGRWVSVDFHIHSIYSGGMLTPEAILDHARRHFLDAVAISDHFQVRGAQEAEAFTAVNRGYPQVVFAEEVSAGDHFHLLIIGPHVPWRKSKGNMLEDLLEHRQKGGAVILAHPWTIPQHGRKAQFLRELISANLIDGAELFNASIMELPKSRLHSIETFWKEWIVPNRLAVVGGSDFHQGRNGRGIGKGRTYLKVFQPGEAGIIEGLRARRSVAGLFSQSSCDLGWLGIANHFLLGLEPWNRELSQLQADLNRRITKYNRFNGSRYKVLSNLLHAGHFQLVRDIIYKKNFDWKVSDATQYIET